MKKEEALASLRTSLIKDKLLPLRQANLVFGEGNSEAEVMFIGEAPGFHEDREGRPFVGPAGQLFNRLFQEAGWQRENVYITNIVKRRPPNNRDPLREEITAYEPYLKRQIEIINPKIIVPLGRFSMNYFLPYARISKDQGKIFWWNKKIIYPLYHPAAALRSQTVANDLRKSLLGLPKILREFEVLLKQRRESDKPPRPMK